MRRLAQDITLAEQTINTIIVSPIARPNPKTTAANTPGSAAGITICHAVCQRDAPSASAACV